MVRHWAWHVGNLDCISLTPYTVKVARIPLYMITCRCFAVSLWWLDGHMHPLQLQLQLQRLLHGLASRATAQAMLLCCNKSKIKSHTRLWFVYSFICLIVRQLWKTSLYRSLISWLYGHLNRKCCPSCTSNWQRGHFCCNLGTAGWGLLHLPHSIARLSQPNLNRRTGVNFL